VLHNRWSDGRDKLLTDVSCARAPALHGGRRGALVHGMMAAQATAVTS